MSEDNTQFPDWPTPPQGQDRVDFQFDTKLWLEVLVGSLLAIWVVLEVAGWLVRAGAYFS